MHSYATKGTFDLGGNISFSSVSNISDGSTGQGVTLLSISPKVGFFPIQGLEIGFNPGLSIMELPSGYTLISPEGRSSSSILQLFAFAGYNFRLEGSSIVPYFEVPFGYTRIGGGYPESGFSWGARGGIKVVPVNHFILNIGLEYWQLTFNEAGAGSRTGANIFTIGLGVGAYL
jgi:hypothetical protein